MNNRTIVAAVGMLLSLVPAPASAAGWDIHISSPKNYQTFQRDNSDRATFTISGWYVGNPRQIQASWRGSRWTTIDNTLTRGKGSFKGTLTGTAGQGTLAVKFSGTTLTDKVYYVGVGDVYVAAGQSNMMGFAPRLHQYTPTKVKAVMLSTGNKWTELRDPYSVASDPKYARGSFIAWIANEHLRKTGVPLAVIPAAKGGSAIRQWTRDGTLYGAMRERVRVAGGKAKAVLWVQGESDSDTPTDVYADALSVLGDNVNRDFRGAKLVPAIIGSYMLEGLHRTNPRIGTIQAVDGNDNMILGPSLYDVNLDDENGDGVHFQSDRDLAVAGHRFWLVLDEAFYGGEHGQGPNLEETNLNGTTVRLRFDTDLTVTASTESFHVTDNDVRVPVVGMETEGDTINLTLQTPPTGQVAVSYGHDNRSAVGKAVYNDEGLPALPFHNRQVNR